MFRGKIIIIGAGAVGAATAYTIMLGGLFNEIAIIDINRDKAEGEAMDMNHGVSFVKPVTVTAGDYSVCEGADIVVITAGAAQREGETRLDLLHRNAHIFKGIIESVMRYAPSDVILLPVTNPVDILTYITWKISGLDKRQVIGSGTVLDTSRLKYMISRHTGVDARNCHTYIIGEHGDSEVAAWSITNIAGMSMAEYARATGKCTPADMEHMYKSVKSAAYEIIEKKGSTCYAIALAVARIAACIAGEENSVLTVSGIFSGEYGIDDIALSVPMLVSGYGIERIFEVPLNEREMSGLRDSAARLHAELNALRAEI